MLIKRNMSEEAKLIIENGFGFRDDSIYGEKITNFEKVLYYEVMELDNDDIFEFVNSFYNLNLPCLCLSKKNTEKVYKFFTNYFKTDKLFCQWLCDDVNCIIDFYCNGDKENLTDLKRVIFNSENVLVVSDLACVGILLVSNEKFILKNERIRV